MLPRFGGSHGGGDFAYRIPLAWAPENEQHYSCPAWAQDLQLRLMLTDLQPIRSLGELLPSGLPRQRQATSCPYALRRRFELRVVE